MVDFVKLGHNLKFPCLELAFRWTKLRHEIHSHLLSRPVRSHLLGGMHILFSCFSLRFGSAYLEALHQTGLISIAIAGSRGSVSTSILLLIAYAAHGLFAAGI